MGDRLKRMAGARQTVMGLSLVLLLAACGGTSSNPGPAASQPPTAGMKPPTSIGTGEGQLNLIAWEGYAEKDWVQPFQQQTGCQVNAKYAGSSDEMVTLMANGGGGQYDMVSASGDADLRLIYGGDVKPVNVELVPDWKNFQSQFKSPSFNTINGIHYGVSLQWGPNVLLYNKTQFPSAPSSWSAIYDAKYKGKVTIPNNPIQIADAALYLMKTQSNLGITDPYELTQSQFDAAVNLLKQQRPLIKKYWDLASQEISLFTNHDVPTRTSSINFTPGAALGLHHLGNKITWSLEARYMHISNAGLTRLNPGLNTVQVRFGLGRFGK